MEVNTSEKVYLSVDGIAKTFSSCVGHPKFSMNDGKTISRPDVTGVNSKSSTILLQYRNATQHIAGSGKKVSNISKAGMGIIKTVRAQWRHQEKKSRVVRSSSAGNRHPSSDRFPKRSPDPQVALAHHDLICPISLEEMRLTKPRNCRRIVVLGAPKVGKTNILRRFLRDGFEEQYEPTAEDFHRKLYHIRGETYQIDILDAARERNFPAKRRLSILTGDIFLLVFSVDDRQSFKEVCALRQEIVAAKTKLMKLKETASVPIVICGNKVDLDKERVVSRSEMCQVLGEDTALFETSAKDGSRLQEMFEALAKLGGFPTETGPLQHQQICIHTYQTMRTNRRDRRGSRALSDAPCGAEYPLARRPSFNSDLRRVLGPGTTKRSKPIEKCQIQ